MSCSTHSDVRWRDDRRRGPRIYFSEAATNKLLPQAPYSNWRKTPCHRHSEIRAHELRAQARKRYESISVPQDNPLDSRTVLVTYDDEEVYNKKEVSKP